MVLRFRINVLVNAGVVINVLINAGVVIDVEEDEEKGSDSGISDASGQQAVAPSYVQLLTQVHISTSGIN